MDLMQNDPRTVIEADRAHVWHHLVQHKPFETIDPQIIVEGKGLRVWDISGKEHVDAVSGAVWTVNVGYGRESIANAVRDQLVKMCYFAGAKGTIPGAQFAKRLIEKMPGLTRVYYANSGSEANEKAFKMVRQISHKHHGGKKSKILYRERDYHGTTIACLSAGWPARAQRPVRTLHPRLCRGAALPRIPRPVDRRGLRPQGRPSDRRRDPARRPRHHRRAVPRTDHRRRRHHRPAQGLLGAGSGDLPQVRHPLHIDEVVCGLGRTGTWFGYQQFGIQPDIVTMAKGVASGYAAISCCVTTDAVFEQFKDDTDHLSYFRDISTFGGCTAGPTAALENMRIIEDEDLCGNSARIGEHFAGRLTEMMDKHAHIGDVRGMGLFRGIELVQDRETKVPTPEKQVQAIVADCMKQGVIIGATNRSVPGFNNTLLFAPALIATKDDIDHICAAVDGAITRVLG
jgi:taurine-pyruvate aminotransferase